MGKKTEGVLAYTGNADWNDYDGSVGWACDLWKGTDATILWSVPMMPDSASLSEAAKGDYNNHYINAAKQILGFRPNDKIIYIRTAWGFNGDQYDWSVPGQADNFISAWIQFVKSFRSVSQKFNFTWAPNFGEQNIEAEKCYPGNDYVDIIGVDIFDETVDSKIYDYTKRWNWYLSRPYGLTWFATFARKHNKGLAIPAWGVGDRGSGDNSYFVEQMWKWMISNHVIYENYWDANVSYNGMVRNNQNPQVSKKYRQLFGKN